MTSLYTNSTGIPGGSTSITNTGSTIYSQSYDGGNSGYITSESIEKYGQNGALVYNTNTILTGHTIRSNIQLHIKSQIIARNTTYINEQYDIYTDTARLIRYYQTIGVGVSNVRPGIITNGFSGGGGGNKTYTRTSGTTLITFNPVSKTAFGEIGSDIFLPSLSVYNDATKYFYNDGLGYGTGAVLHRY